MKNLVGKALKLEYKGTILQDEKRVSDYEIQKDDTILLEQVEISTKGVEKLGIKRGKYKSGVKYNFSSGEPSSRFCVRGLNIEGICKNKSCSEYSKLIICPIG